jgi:4-amino-4-deoxy-L-arabinose transferase-like glycosyltransferase
MIFVIYAMVDTQRKAPVDRLITAGWLGSMVLLAIGMLWFNHWRLPKWEQIKSWFETNKWEFLILLGIIFVGAFLRTYQLTQHPFPWSGDEASVGIEGTRILSGEVRDFFAAGWSGQPNWSFVPTALAEVIFGKTILAVRIVSAVEGTLAVLFIYLLARELFGRTIATLAAGFLAAFPFHLQFSRIGVNNIIDSFTVCLVLWLTLRAIRKGRPADYMWVGLAGGLAFYTYVGSRLVPALGMVVIAYTAIRQRGYLRSQWRNILVFLGTFILVISPLAYYFIRHPDIFMTRLGQESIFLNRWIFLQSQRTGQSVASLLWKQFTDTVLVYISQPAIGNFFNSPLPYLTILGSLFFLFGMGFAFVRLLETRMMTLLVWFWAVVIFGGVLTLSPPANTRLVMTSPAVAIFVALGIYKFTELLMRLKIFNQKGLAVVSSILVVALVAQNIAFYFGIYRSENYFEDANGEFAQKIGLELKQLGPSYDYYLFGLPRVFAAFPTVVYLSPKNSMYDLNDNSINDLALVPGKSNIFVAIPENRADLEQIRAKFPGGTWEEVPRRYKVEVLYYAYILPSTAVP